VPAAARASVVVVDDEAPVREVLSEELAKKGYRVFTASNPAAGAVMVQERAGAGDRVMIVVDLKMPTSTGKSFFGGFELVRRVHKTLPGVPVLLMAETLSEKAKARAKELGIRRLAYKPTLSKIDAKLYVQDLREYASTVGDQLSKLQADHPESGNGRPVEPAPSPVPDSLPPDFLAAMTKKLVDPGGSTDVSRLVMEVASKFLERGVLFVVKGDTARGLAAFGVGRTVHDCSETAQTMAVEIGHSPPFAEAVRRGSAYRLSSDLSFLDAPVFQKIGRRAANEAVLIPLLYNRATLLLLYGDNGPSGRPLGELSGLELFVAQAGMALENKLLQRKLSGVEESNVADEAPNAHV
jgi:CheY-like chemotaxis protein